MPTRKVKQDAEEFYNCQALSCPETMNLTTIVNDTRFDYYTLYAYPPRNLPSFFIFLVSKISLTAPNNSTCLPTIGVFFISDQRSNFSTATKACRASSGNLAHILSYERTNQISNLLKTNFTNKDDTLAYVGLNETILNKFETSINEPLSPCFQFRAWAAGHP